MTSIENSIPVNNNPTPISGKGEIFDAIESQIKTPSVKAQLKTTVSKLAIALPGFFMSDTDAAKMIQMLRETRNEIYDVGKFDKDKPLNEQRFPQVANDNKLPMQESKIVA